MENMLYEQAQTLGNSPSFPQCSLSQIYIWFSCFGFNFRVHTDLLLLKLHISLKEKNCRKREEEGGQFFNSLAGLHETWSVECLGRFQGYSLLNLHSSWLSFAVELGVMSEGKLGFFEGLGVTFFSLFSLSLSS